MFQLKTVFSYGLNDQIGDVSKEENTHALAGKTFPHLARNCPRVIRESRHQNHNVMTAEYFLKIFVKSWILTCQMY